MHLNGLITYSNTINIGDDIQSLSICQLMDKIDVCIDREHISDYVDPCKVIINGWYKHNVSDWPPHSNINPLFISFHINNCALLSNIYYLKKYEPIGCRDLYTLNMLKSSGIKAYFSGCSTITLNSIDVEKENKVICIDIPRYINLQSSDFKCEYLSTHIPCYLSCHERLSLAYNRLKVLSSSRCVITSRLHTALPCIAMGIPVFLIPMVDIKRFEGLLDIFHYSNINSDLNTNIVKFIDNPRLTKNDEKVNSMRDLIRKKVREFYT